MFHFQAVPFSIVLSMLEITGNSYIFMFFVLPAWREFGAWKRQCNHTHFFYVNFAI